MCLQLIILYSLSLIINVSAQWISFPFRLRLSQSIYLSYKAVAVYLSISTKIISLKAFSTLHLLHCPDLTCCCRLTTPLPLILPLLHATQYLPSPPHTPACSCLPPPPHVPEPEAEAAPIPPMYLKLLLPYHFPYTHWSPTPPPFCQVLEAAAPLPLPLHPLVHVE